MSFSVISSFCRVFLMSDAKSMSESTFMHNLYIELLNTYQIPTEFVPELSKVLHKVFNDYNGNKSTMRSDLKKRKSEIINKIEKVQVHFGPGLAQRGKKTRISASTIKRKSARNMQRHMELPLNVSLVVHTNQQRQRANYIIR